MVDSLKFEQERLIQMASEEAEEKVAKAISEKKEAIKALEEERADRKATKATIREDVKEDAIGDILKYEMNYRRFALFMIRRKYPDLDFSDINFTDIEGYNIPNLADGSESIGDLNTGNPPKRLLTRLLVGKLKKKIWGKSKWNILKGLK